MRKLLLTFALLAMTSTAKADRVGDFCGMVTKGASSIMVLRQSGVPAIEVFQFLEDFPVLSSLILDAYKVPHYSTPEYKMRAVKEFSESTEIKCLKLYGKITES